MKNTILTSARFCLFAFLLNSIISANAINSVLSTGTWYKLSASETGIYIITYNDLAALGISVSTIDPRNISLYGNGPGELPLLNSIPRPIDLQELAIEIKGENDGVFDVSDTIFFYNHSQMTWTKKNNSRTFIHHVNHYSDSTYFFLTVGSVAGKRIQDRQSMPTFTDATFSYTEYSIHESEQINLLHTGKEWYGEHFTMTGSSIQSFPVNMNDLTVGDSVYVNVNFVGRDTLSTTSTLTWSLNGYNSTSGIQMVGTSPQDNYGGIINNNSFVVAPLTTDSITISFQSSNPTAEGWLNFIEINAIRNLIFDQSPMSFRDVRNVGAGHILNYNISANAGIKIWDVTSFNAVENQLYSVSTPNINFNAVADSLNEYIAFDGSNYIQPRFIGAISNQNLHVVANKNMIIVTDKNFLNEATTLAQYHQTVDNLSTVAVTSQEIFNEYGSGSQDPVAIRDFLRQVYHSAGTSADSLKYVLMFGAPSFDYKNILGYGQTVIPIYETDGSINLIQSYCTDDFYTLMDSSEGDFYSNNDIPDFAIGRIPVKTAQEAQIINKIMAYSTSSAFGIWRTKVTAVADDQDGNIHFRQSDTLSNRIENFNCGLNLNKIYIDAFVQNHDSITNLDTYPEANLKIGEAFQQGCAVIQYIGQGDAQGWASERILEYNFLDTVNNISNLPVILAGTVSFNVLDDPGQISAASAAFFNPNGGCIASMAPARLAFSSSNFNLMIKINQELYEQNSGKWPTLGDAHFYAKKMMYTDPYVRSFSLLGDPATRILFPENNVIVTSLSRDTIGPGQTVQVTGEVQDAFGSVMTLFNGPIDITFFNPKTRHTTLGNDSANTSNPGLPVPFMLWDDTLYNATVNVVNGAFSLSFVMPSNVDSGFGTGRIAFYANDGVVDAMGCYQNFILGDLTAGISEYSNLEIQLFPNPSVGQIKCVLNNFSAKEWSFTLTSMDGRLFQNKKIDSPEFIIERNEMASGIYFLKIVDATNNVVRVEKVVFE